MTEIHRLRRKCHRIWGGMNVQRYMIDRRFYQLVTSLLYEHLGVLH